MKKQKPTAETGKATVETPNVKRVRASLRQSREHEIIASDRVPLIQAANEFVGHIVCKQVAPVCAAAFITDIPLSSQEEKTYEAALSFLERQFERGSADAESVVKRFETEACDEVEKL